MGASRERVNYIARVEDVKTILDSTQVRYLATCAFFFFFFLNQYSHAAYTMARPLGPVGGPAARTGRNLTNKQALRKYTKETT